MVPGVRTEPKQSLPIHIHTQIQHTSIPSVYVHHKVSIIFPCSPANLPFRMCSQCHMIYNVFECHKILNHQSKTKIQHAVINPYKLTYPQKGYGQHIFRYLRYSSPLTLSMSSFSNSCEICRWAFNQRSSRASLGSRFFFLKNPADCFLYMCSG